jgi:branched-subunit amino acid ABC-type transport system permease component
MDQFVRDLITSFVTAGLVALMSAGVVLTYATTRIFNFGYAGVAYSGAYIFFELNTGAGWPSWAAAVFVIVVVCPLLGVVLDVAIFRRLAEASESAQIVATVGVLLALPALCIYVVQVGIGGFGWNIPQGLTILQVPGPGPQPVRTFHLLSGVAITSDQIIVLGVAVVCISGLTIFLNRSHTGLKMRALADRRDLAETRGINDGHMSRLAWILGSVLAGIAGVVGAPLLHSLDTGIYTLEVFIAVCAAVLGRFRSIPLAVVGAISISVISDLVISYWHWASNVPGFSDSIPFLFLIFGFLAFGTGRVRLAGVISAETPPPDYHRDLPTWRRLLPSAIGIALLIVFVFFIMGEYWVQATTQGLIYSLIFLSITIITGIGGMVSLAQAAFVSGGALFAGMLIQRYGLPWFPALLCAVLACVLFGVLVALTSLRLNGIALALSTLALAFVSSDLLFQLNWLGNGLTGWQFTQPKIGPFDLSDEKTMAGFVLILILGTVLLIRNLQRSTTGRQMLAVRNSPVAAASIGVSPTSTKLKLFALSAGIAALGGVLLATTQVNITSGTTGSLPYPLVGLLWLAVVVVYGVRRPAGAIVGGLVIALFPALLSGGFTLPFHLLSWSGTQATEILTALFGLGAVFLARQPDGSFQDIARRNFERRQRRQQRRSGASYISGGKGAPAVPIAPDIEISVNS